MQDVSEHNRGQDTQCESEKRFRALIEHGHDAFALCGADGTIFYASPSTTHVIGYLPEDLHQRSLLEFVRPDWQDLIRAQLAESLRRPGVGIPAEGYVLHKDGQWRFLEGTFTNLLHEPGVGAIVNNYRDITERKRAEDSVRQRVKELNTIYEVARKLQHLYRPQTLAREIIGVLEGVLNYTYCSVLLIEGTTGRLIPFAISTIEQGPEHYKADVAYILSREPRVDKGITGWVARHGKSVSSGNIQADSRYFAIRKDIASELCVPLRAADQIIGVVNIESIKPNAYTEYDQWLLETVASQIAIAIQNSRLYEQVQQELSERQHAEAALKESELRYRTLVTQSPIGIYETDSEGRCIFVNERWSQISGFSAETARGDGWVEAIYPDDRADVSAKWHETVLSGHPFDAQYRILTPQGVVTWVHGLSASVRNEHGEIVGHFGTISDITERKRVEDALRESESFRRTIVESEPECVKLVAPDLTLLDMNPAGLEMIGAVSREQVIGQSVLTLIAPEWHETFKEMHEKVLDGNSAVAQFETCGLHGVRRLMETHAVPLRNKESKVIAQLAITRDITEPKRAEEKLRQSEERYRELFENAKDAIYVQDLAGVYASVNRAAETLSGYDRNEIIGKHFNQFVAPEYLPLASAQFSKKLADQEQTAYEIEVIARDGRRVPIELSSALILKDGVPVGIQGIARDISERKRAEEKLRSYSRQLIDAQESERQHIARELHDQIGQMLTAVRINLQTIRNSCETNESQTLIDQGMTIIDSALEQVRDLSFELRPSLLDGLGLVAALRWYADQYAQRTGIRTKSVTNLRGSRLQPELETACFRIVQEALTNVVRHANARNVAIDLRTLDRRIVLSIRDDGIGFDELSLNGAAAIHLGLRGMKERALALGGTLEIVSAPAQGTEIRASFPTQSTED